MSNLALQMLPLPGERLAGGRVKGSLIRAHVDWVRDYTSREEMIELFEAIPADVRQQISTLLPGAWYDFATLVALDRTILSIFGSGDVGFLEQLGANTARMILPTLSPCLQHDGVHEFFGRLASLHHQIQEPGTAAYLERTPTTGTMHHRGCPSVSPLYCASTRGFYRACATLHGATDVNVTETECQCFGAPACTFSIAWR